MGGSIGFANIETMGGSYTYSYYDQIGVIKRVTLPINVEVNPYGATGEFDMKMHESSCGEMYLDILGSKNSVPAGTAFTMYGQYEHVWFGLGATVSVGTGGITFDINPTSRVTKSTQIMYNNLIKY